MARLLIVALLLAFSPAVTNAQRPDFSGEWTRVVDSSATRSSVAATGDAAFRRGDMGSGWGSPLIIRQTPDSMIVEYQQFSTYDLQPRLHFVYRLNGSESRNTIMIGHADSPQRSRASWSGDTLVVVTTFPAPTGGGTTTMRQALSVGADGMLTLETSRDGSPALRTTYRKR
jgi:hypothetical protein